MSGTSTWARIKAALRREKADVDEALAEFEVKANAALEERERELRATPEERLAMEQRRGAENDEQLEAIRKRIEGGRA